ncbi:MAG: starch-binding protein [Bacteroidetes bacterium]|nr:starch-binding protein [Bacteroidota bacterium]
MTRTFFLLLFFLLPFSSTAQQIPSERKQANPPIYIAFLWHMHQPIYWPYESIVQTESRGAYSYSVYSIHNSRSGPYTTWPWNAVQKGISAGLGHFGAQVSFSGSLIENLNNLKTAGQTNFSNWTSSWVTGKAAQTSLGNPRLDMIGFGYHHPLMGLIRYEDIRRQIAAHRDLTVATFGGSYSKGIFPPENAFANRMIPALADEGIEWVLVDNIHFDRAAANYPWNKGGSVVEPNPADQLNADPGDWVQLNGLWAPTKTSARWGRQPRYVSYTDPATGVTSKIIAVPTDRYMGNEDGRGGFGALNYESVMSQIESYNTDPDHPILIVLHHDGDNFGGGTESYYGSNFQSFVDWVKSNSSRFVCTTVQDYLEQFPPNPDDVIHIEAGSWAGADAGDPEFKKWLGDPSGGYSPDWNSWASITYAQNLVSTADQQAPGSPSAQNGWKYLMNAQASDYWYWDGTEMWDSHPTRGANLAVESVLPVISEQSDLTPPTIFVPQREPYNPGGMEWEKIQPKTFTVTTLVADFSGVESVVLKVRQDLDGKNGSSTQNETYAGGSEVGDWISLPMVSTTRVSQTDPLPLGQATYYEASVTGYENALLDYYVEATDKKGHVARSPILHVWVDDGETDPNPVDGPVTISPAEPTINDTITIQVKKATIGGKLHWGVNNAGSNWQKPDQVYWPEGSALFGGTGPAVQSPFSGPVDSVLTIKIGPFNHSNQKVYRVAFVLNYNNGTWDNNGGKDFGFEVSGNDTGTDSLVVHFYKPVNWGSAWCYYWNSAGGPGPGWPGTAMTSEGEGWYRFVIKNTTQANLIFSDNGSKQTADLFRSSEGWYYNGAWYNSKPVVVSASSETPLSFSLGNPWPNPFNPTARIPVTLPTSQKIRLEVYDLLGKQAMVLANGVYPRGKYEFGIRATGLASGMYIVRLTGAEGIRTQRLVLAR